MENIKKTGWVITRIAPLILSSPSILLKGETQLGIFGLFFLTSGS
jgi:hypothetical protein